MSTGLEEKVGLKLETYTFRIEKGKIKELALAIGDLKEEYLNGESVPPSSFPYPIIGGSDIEWAGDCFVGIGNAEIRERICQ